MKIRIAIFLFLFIKLCSAQNVVFNKIETTFPNTDQFLYKIENGNPEAKFLAEIEIQGYSTNYVETFKKIIGKAKEVGANAFSYQPFLKIDMNENTFDVANFKLNLYHLDKNLFPDTNNEVFLIASANKDQKLSWNDDKLLLKENSFLRLKMLPGEIYTLSTRRIFGSSVKLSYSKNQQIQYFLISSFKIKSDKSGVGGLNLKSGDINLVDRSFGDFLTVVLKYNDNQ